MTALPAEAIRANFLRKQVQEGALKNIITRSLEHFRAQAVSSGLIDATLLERYLAAKAKSKLYYSPLMSRNRSEDQLGDIFREIGGLSQEEKAKVSNYMMAEISVLGSLHAMERAFNTPSPEERFTDLFDKIFARVNDDERARVIIQEISKKIKNHKTYTSHPTIMQTLAGILLEANIIAKEEEAVELIKLMENAESAEPSPENIFSQIDELVNAAAGGKTKLTHYTPVSLEEEDRLEYRNYDERKEQDIAATAAWNNAAARHPKLQGIDVTISEDAIVRRTWGRRADKDGREKSNALDLYKNISRNVHHNSFDGPKYDLRDNAKQHSALVSAMIQVALRRSAKLKPYVEEHDNGAFVKFCTDFVEKLNAAETNGKTWKDPSDTIYQELNSHRAEFLRELLNSDFELTPRSIVAHAVPVAKRYTEQFISFRTKYNAWAEANDQTPLPEFVTFNGLAGYKCSKGKHRHQNAQLEFREFMKNADIVFQSREKQSFGGDTIGGNESINVRITANGLHYILDGYQGEYEYFLLRKTASINPETGEAGEVRNMNPEERDNSMDMLRRLEIISYYARKLGGNVVADRYEIANFSSAENFYEVMLMFRETGLLEIQKGTVTRSDIGIMPLLETLEDLENAEAIFTQLLDDPLARSFWEHRGYAQIMVGFSDGAKSAGSWASEDTIRRTTEKLYKLFESRGIRLEIKQGRGNNTNRGGIHEDGLSQAHLSHTVNANAESSVTEQSDHPTQRANSFVHGLDQMASSLIGAASGAVGAATATAEQEEFNAVCDEAFQLITRISSAYFREIVRTNKVVEDLLNDTPYNADGSSRNSARGGNKASAYEDMRAVPVSIRAAMANMPLYNIGLQRAFKALMSGEEIGITENKQPVRINFDEIRAKLDKYKTRATAAISSSNPGMEYLHILKRHPFFENFMRRQETELQRNYDPNLTRVYGRFLGEPDFAEVVTSELDGLKELFQLTLRGVSGYSRFTVENSLVQQELQATRLLGHGILTSLPLAPRRGKPDEQLSFETQRDTLCVLVNSNDLAPEPAPRMKHVPERVWGLN